VCFRLSLLFSLELRCVGRVLVYMCVAHMACIYSPSSGPCTTNYIPTLLGLEEYIESFPPTVSCIMPKKKLVVLVGLCRLTKKTCSP
jgi:hypothetical protein